MKLDIPDTDLFDDEITAIGDDDLYDEMEDPLNDDFAPWLDTALNSSDADDDQEGPPVGETPSRPQTAVSSAETDKLSSLVLDDWDPVRFEHEEPSSQCQLRLHDDLLHLSDHPLPGVHIEPVEVSLFHLLVVGPSGTPYEGGFFHFLMQCPKDYPMRPPRVRLMSTDDESVSFNPKLCSSGRVSLDILCSSDTPEWSPAHSISGAVVSIRSLLTEKPHINDPNWRSEVDCENYSRVVQHETIRVAVCDAIDACLNGSSLCPGYLQEEMLNHFMAYYETYEKVVVSNLHLTGADMRDPRVFDNCERGQYQYESLLVKLRKMKAAMHELIKARHEGEQ